jgi:tetratricopeptide (TPR) repeat protein
MPARRSLDATTSWALLATVVVALFAVLPASTLPFGALKSFVLAAGALIALALYILARLSRGNVVFPPLVLVGALWLPVVAYLLSSAFSGVSFMTALWGTSLEADTLGFILVVAVLGTLTALTLRRSEHYRTFLTVGTYAFAVLAGLQVLTVLGGQVMPNSISPTLSFVGSFSDLADVMGLGVVSILLTLRFTDLSRRTHKALLIAGALALFVLAVANSTLIWGIVALVSLGLFVESVMRRGSRGGEADLDAVMVVDEAPSGEDSGTHSLVAPLVVLALAIFFLLGSTLGNALATSLHVNLVNVRPSWQSTLAVAHQAYSTTPVFGSGPTTFGGEWLKYRDASLNSTVFWNLDFSSGIGFIPSSLVTTGIIGAIAWLLFLGAFVVLGLRMLLRAAPTDSFIRYVSVLSFIGTVYLFALAILDVPGSLVIALAFVFAGLFISTMRFGARGQQWGILFARSPRIGFLIVFSLTIVLLGSVVAAYTLVEHAIASVELSQAATALNAGNLDAADAAAQKSLSFAPSSAAYQVEAAVANARLNQIAASTTMERTAAQQAYQAALTAGINAALTATNIDPRNYQNWVALGNLYAQAVPLNVSGAYDSAKTAYGKAVALNPTNPQIPYILAQLDIAHNDMKSAEADLKEAITLKQDYTAAIFLLSQLEVRDGNVKDALQAALAAAYFTPNDPNILFQVGILYAAENDLQNAQAALAAAVATNPQFANARYFLSAVYAKAGDMTNALAQMQAIADLSSDNATAVASQLASLKAGKSPFPANLLSISNAPAVK